MELILAFTAMVICYHLGKFNTAKKLNNQFNDDIKTMKTYWTTHFLPAAYKVGYKDGNEKEQS